MLHRLLTAVAKGIVVPAYARRFRRFESRLCNARRVQRQLLFAWLRRCKSTRFGREHGFSEIRSVEDYRRRVPLAGYSAFEPYIDAIGRGETNLLFPAEERVRRFTITTGTTGVPKLNPVTPTWLRRYRRAWNLWGGKMLADHPEKVGGKIMQIIGSWDMGRTPAGIPISMVSALLSRSQHPLARRFFAVPADVTDIPDPTARYYATMRLSIAEQIGLIVLMNPGSLLRLVKLADEHREALIRDIHDGTLSSAIPISSATRSRLAPYFSRPNPRRARTLEQIVSRTGRLYPKDYWPNPIIACWLGGTAGYQARYFAEFFGDAPLREQGLVSSEGRHTIPIEDTRPQGVLSIETGFYEFVPAAEVDSRAPNVLEGYELEPDRDYSLVMTTHSGYFRYQIGDLVRCRGFVGEAPLLEFLQKSGRCGDLEGEKVTEHQFLAAVAGAAKDMSLTIGPCSAVPLRADNGRPGYAFLIEQVDVPAPEVAGRFLASIDRRIMQDNFLYSARRREGVLDAPQLWRLPTGTWDALMQTEISRRGTGDAQYKHPGLVTDASWLGQFQPIDIMRAPLDRPA
jgi:GH3 auxin-responsive promoter